MDNDPIEVRTAAAEALLLGTLNAVRLLRSQVDDPALEARDRRAAAVALLTLAGVAESTPKGSGVSTRPAAVSGLLDLLSGRQERQRGYVHDGVGPDPFAPSPLTPPSRTNGSNGHRHESN